MKSCVQKLFVLLVLLAGTHQAAAIILFADNFDANQLDAGKWTTDTSLSDVYGTPMVIVQNQRCEITGRGYLNTVTNYDPSAPGGLLITGTWTFVNDTGGGGDLPWVVTRSSGVPTAYYVASGEVTDGVNFRISVPPAPAPPNAVSIVGRGAATITGLNVVSNTLNLAQGDSASFAITDDGTNLTFYLVKIGDPSQAAYATATCTSRLAVNKISFYNREYSSDTAALDNVVVQTIANGPQLNLAATGNQTVLFWPATGTNYILQSTTNLASPNWITASDAVPVIAVTVTNQLPVRFFRLQAQ